MINLGPVQAFLGRKWRSKKVDSAQVLHDAGVEAEIYRRNKANRVLAKIKDEGRAVAAGRAEEERRRVFDRGHLMCVHCVGPSVPGEAPDG